MPPRTQTARWCACTARTRPAPRSVLPTPSSRPRAASCSRRSSPGASAARTACWPARSACPKYVAEFDQMMKCDMCTDRTARGATHRCARRCARARRSGTARPRSSTRPASGALVDNWLFGRQSVRTKVFTVVDDLGRRSARRARRTTAAPGSTTRSVWRRRASMSRRADPSLNRSGPGTSPTRPAAEEEVTRREFARYLVAGAGVMAAGNVGLGDLDPTPSRSTPASRGPIVPSTRWPSGTPTCSATPTDADPAILAAARRPRGGGLQPEVHPSRLRRLLRSRGEPVALPVPRGELRRTDRCRASPGPRPRPLGRIDLEIRDDVMVWALGVRAVRVSDAIPAGLVGRGRCT